MAYLGGTRDTKQSNSRRGKEENKRRGVVAEATWIRGSQAKLRAKQGAQTKKEETSKQGETAGVLCTILWQAPWLNSEMK